MVREQGKKGEPPRYQTAAYWTAMVSVNDWI
jgi:hypothetical protein